MLILFIPFIIVFLFIEDNQDKYDQENKEIMVRVKREDTNEIEKIPLEDYVIGVVAGEMPVYFHIEALKAQAVAARSYVLKRINNNSDYDVVDSVRYQVYLDNDYLKKSWQQNYEKNITRIKEAVLLTKREYIEYNGEIADALYFSTSNGYTENSEEIFTATVPYLRSVESGWDQITSPVFNDKKKYSLHEFYKLINIPYNKQLNIMVIKNSSTGRILEIIINNNRMTGSELALKLNLRSNDFKINHIENDVIINTTGFGHGVGMSQYGALGMASEGYLYDEILKYYYKGVEIKEISY